MTINHQFGGADANGAVTGAQALALGAEHQAIVRDVLAAATFCSGGRSTTVRYPIGPHFPVIYEQADSRPPATNVADTNSAVGCAWSKPTRQGGHMSFVTTQPEMLAAAAGDLEGIGSAMNAQNLAAAAPTTGVVPAAADEVSALTAAQFAAHAQMYQAMSAQAAGIHEMFVNTLGTTAGCYAATEAANTVAAG